MTDRLLVFSNPEVQKLLKEKFIPVACNDWYQRRRQDDEGEFFRSVANQGPRKGKGGSTRQGHYVLTAGGKLLGFNNNRGAEKRLQMMGSALEQWNKLPAADKHAKVPDQGKLDAKYHRALPKDAQVIKTYTRALEMHGNRFSVLKENIPGRLAAVDHLWLTKQELAQINDLMKSGGGLIPKRLAFRLARYHFLDSTRGEPPFWKVGEMRDFHMKINKAGKLTGQFHMETTDFKRGYRGVCEGYIAFSKQGELTGLEFLALGKHWGEGRYTRGARPGRTLLGIYFELVKQPKAADLIPPQGMHWEQGYWQAEK